MRSFLSARHFILDIWWKLFEPNAWLFFYIVSIPPRKVVYEEFGSTKRYYRADHHYAVITASVSLGLPFMSWQYMIPGGGWNLKLTDQSYYRGFWVLSLWRVNHPIIVVPLNPMASLRIYSGTPPKSNGWLSFSLMATLGVYPICNFFESRQHRWHWLRVGWQAGHMACHGLWRVACEWNKGSFLMAQPQPLHCPLVVCWQDTSRHPADFEEFSKVHSLERGCRADAGMYLKTPRDWRMNS